MKIKSYITMLVATLAIATFMCSCSSDDDEVEAPVATQVAGTYTGDESVMVMGDETKENVTYVFSKATDISVDMTVPQIGGEGSMVIPSVIVKDIPLTKKDNTITGKVTSYKGKVTDAKGAEKEFVISDLTVIFNGKTVAATFSLKYGAMPFAMATTFTGTKK